MVANPFKGVDYYLPGDEGQNMLIGRSRISNWLKGVRVCSEAFCFGMERIVSIGAVVKPRTSRSEPGTCPKVAKTQIDRKHYTYIFHNSIFPL